MDYDFNNVRQMLDNGASIEDICQAFADKANAANAEYELSQKRHITYSTALVEAATAWNNCIDRYVEINKVDCRPVDYYITPETVDNLMTVLFKIIGWGEVLAPLMEKMGDSMNNESSKEKIGAKKSGPTQVSEFSHVIADFLNDID